MIGDAGDGDGASVNRRGFLELLGASAFATITTGGGQAQIDDPTDPAGGFEQVGLLIGPASARPEPGGQYLERFDTFRLAYFATDTGAKSYITHTFTSWQPMATEFTGPETQVDEVRTENFQSFFNHTFARPEAPDDKNWDYTDSDVTKQDSEIELASTTTLETRQRGNYPPGSEAIPGVAWRVTDTPTGGRGDGGYFDANNGVGVGEDTTDSYVFIRKGGTEKLVHREDWNQHVPSDRVWVDNRPVITRFPHLFYGGGDLEVRAMLHDGQNSRLRTLHRFTPESVDDTFTGGGPPIDQPNLPARFESSSLTGGSVRANAAHYEFGEVETESRVNGEHFTDVDAGTSGWTELITWQKRTGWEMVNVEPLKITAAAEKNDAKLALQLNPTLSNTSTSLPTNTSSDETAVEIVDGSFDAVGERRWPGYATSGQGNTSGTTTADSLTFNLPVGQPVSLVAQGVGGTATVSGAVAWEEFF